MKNAFRLSFFALMLVCLSAGVAAAQATAPTTRDSSFTQITSSTANAFVGGISGDGRFVVFESTGDHGSLYPGAITRAVTNADGNREIYLYDYAQRRTFQITNTTSARKDATKPALSVTNAIDFSNVEVEVSNNRPFISRDGRWIVFSSNADTPFSFDGDANKAALKADGNQEIFLYRIPDVGTVDLTRGTDSGFVNLYQDTFTRVTDTAASRLPVAGTTTAAPIVADDNRMAQANDRASRIVFVSTRNRFVPNGLDFKNTDFTPEVFVWNRTSPVNTQPATGGFVQVTNTTGAFTFNSNPSISGGTSSDTGAEVPGSVISFVSNATDLGTSNADGNAEIFVVTFNGATTADLTQVTRTRRVDPSEVVNVLNPGPRLSRDGRFIAFETSATNPNADTTANEVTRGMFVYTIASNTFLQVGPRGLASANELDVLRFPVFAGTGDNTQIVFTSALNFRPDGTRVAPADTSGLNPLGFKQIFSLPFPFTTSGQTFTRLTNTTVGGPSFLQPFVSNTTERLAFSFNGELGGGNGPATLESGTQPSAEVFYLHVPPAPVSDRSAATSGLSYFTGATRREVVTPAASPTPTPSPAPAATPLTGLAPGMIGIVRAPETEGAVTFAAADTRICQPETFCEAASESRRSPSLPVELAGVSLSINNAAAGLYFVSPKELQFVVPPGLAAQTGTATYPVVINVNEGGAVRTIRSALQVVAAQPDIFTRLDAPTRPIVFNVTNGTSMPEPPEGFPVTSPGMDGAAKPTILAIFLTGVRNPTITRANVTVSIGDRNLTASDIQQLTAGSERAFIPTGIAGIDQLNLILRADMAGLGDQPLVISVTINGQTFTSRPAATAPRIRIR